MIVVYRYGCIKTKNKLFAFSTISYNIYIDSGDYDNNTWLLMVKLVYSLARAVIKTTFFIVQLI